jgi:hypothetical protein
MSNFTPEGEYVEPVNAPAPGNASSVWPGGQVVGNAPEARARLAQAYLSRQMGFHGGARPNAVGMENPMHPMGDVERMRMMDALAGTPQQNQGQLFQAPNKMQAGAARQAGLSLPQWAQMAGQNQDLYNPMP